MINDGERHPMEDPKFSVQYMNPRRTTPPKLRKNLRLEKRWGPNYFSAIKEAVFAVRQTPYTPAEPPISLQDEADDCQSLYVCKQCRDCFRFPSSLEAHTSRRSWILGYWCNNCFFANCSHLPKAQRPCFDCQAINRQKIIFLKAKGLRKGRKIGCVKIFYNQCQFFAHLRTHSTYVVDMADIMLIPLPTDVDKESYPELEQLCGNIMERMFLTRTHILDWLRSHKLDNKWRSLLQPSLGKAENPLKKILEATVKTRRNQRSKHSLKSQKIIAPDPASRSSSSVVSPSSLDTPSSISETIESVVAQSIWEETEAPTKSKIPKMPPLTSIAHKDPLEPIEDDDNPCTTTDIAFVDCGLAVKNYSLDSNTVSPPKDVLAITPNRSNTEPHSSSRRSSSPIILKRRQANKVVGRVSSVDHSTFEPKISVKKFANERLKASADVPNDGNHPKVNNPSSQTLKKFTPALSVRLANQQKSLPPVSEIARTVETLKKNVAQTAIAASGSKILTVHSSKNTELSKIISQLPPEVINGKKIVFISQDPEFGIIPKNDAAKANKGMIRIPSDVDNQKAIQALPAKISPLVVSKNSREQSGNNVNKEISKKSPLMEKIRPKMQQVYLDGKVIYQNGKKFIIRHARKSVPESTICKSINNLKSPTVSKRVDLSTFLSMSDVPVASTTPSPAEPTDSGANKVVCSLAPVPFNPSSSSSPFLSPSTSSTEDPMALKPKSLTGRGSEDSGSVEERSDDLSGTKSSTANSVSRGCSVPRPIDGVKFFAIEKNSAGKLYVDFSKAKPELNWTLAAANYKQYISQKIRCPSKFRIKQQIDHLKDVNDEYSRMAGVSGDAIITGNLRAIERLKKSLATESDQDQDDDEDASSDIDINEILLDSKEAKEPSSCLTCKRAIRSEPYNLEASNESEKSPSCVCNDYVCHVCDIYQGNMCRFAAHINFHSKKEPFTCPECFRKFATFHRLETHIWTCCFHLLVRRWFKCKVCYVEGFLNMESISKHFMLVHSKLKIACPECGILLESRTRFRNHIAKDHPKTINILKPVYLTVCDIGNCVVRVEHYRAHMDHHIAVMNSQSYKCCFCSYIIKAVKRGRERIRDHLYEEHSDKLADLVSLEHLKSECEENSGINEDSARRKKFISNSDRSKEVSESERDTDLSESMQKINSSNSIDKNFDGDNESSPGYIDATLTKQSLKDGLECSIWSINLGPTESSESIDLGPDSTEITKTMLKAASNSNDVINEYNSSPKIFDVRSVTPDSYAELDEVTKDPAVGESRGTGFANTKLFGQSDQMVISEGKTEDSLLIKMGDHSLPVKLPQVILINQAVEGSMNFTEILQSTSTASNTFVKLSEIPKSDDKEVSLPVSKTVLIARPLGQEECKKMSPDSTVVMKSPESVETLSKPCLGARKQMLPVSILKPKDNSVKNGSKDISQSKNCFLDLYGPIADAHRIFGNTSSTDIVEPMNRLSDSYGDVADESQPATNPLNSCEDPLLCSLPKPPPLARIPQHLLEVSREENEVGDHEEEQEPQEIKIISPKSVTTKPWRRGKRPWRMALNSPMNNTEVINYRCHLCGEYINTCWSLLRDHFSTRHSQDYKLSVVTPRLLRMSEDFITEGYKEVLGSKKRKLDNSVQNSSKRRRRWNPRKHVDVHPLGPGLCVQLESVQDGEGNFVCKKCDQRCNDISSLRNHIGTNHRIKDHYLVCLECGENFVVEPSLQMHLKAFHRIKDPSAYMVQNPGYAKDITETGEDGANTGIANQCHVCMAVFEDKLAVDKHLRVHGMAFLNRKRIEARNAARNPEKNSRIDKPEETSTTTTEKNDKSDDQKLSSEVKAVDETITES